MLGLGVPVAAHDILTVSPRERMYCDSGRKVNLGGSTTLKLRQ